MLKRIFATALCFSFLACSMTACGKEVELKESSDSQSSSVSADLQAGEYVNFTAPEKGEQIVIMTIKDMGDIKIKLFPELAPTGVKNFVELAKQGYYDELIFHRVISNFMIQGGDPKGNGTGGSPAEGITFEAGDASPYLTHVSGAVAYANSGSTATNGSQFYIVTGEKYDENTLSQMEQAYGKTYSDSFKKMYSEIGGAPWLDGSYTIFGQVFDGLDIVYKIQNVATDASDKPYDAVTIESVKVAEYDGGDIKWYISDYAEQ
ncbi:MAG: peptidylprolyl isomerase [Oscillospiraceae bacterium]|nr:peptidylprolyl isomerase [Oscillospiraceae bacterium]